MEIPLGDFFSSSRAYKKLRGIVEASHLFKWLWTSSNLGKHKFFVWWLLRDRLNTRNILRRKNRILDDYNCVLCNSCCEETLFHLFFSSARIVGTPCISIGMTI